MQARGFTLLSDRLSELLYLCRYRQYSSKTYSLREVLQEAVISSESCGEWPNECTYMHNYLRSL